jgi:hypothetical protein
MSHSLIAASFLVAATLVGCGGSKSPKSTTTTRTQSTTTTDTGNNTSTDTKETTTEQTDGSSTVETTKTTNTAVPAPSTK